MHLRTLSLLAFLLALAAPASAQDAGRPLAFEDLMRFRQIEGARIADDGSWIAYAFWPDRGDGEAVFRAVEGETEHRVPLGHAPRVGADGRFGVAVLRPSFAERERAKDAEAEDEDEDDGPKPGLALVELATGAVERLERVEAFALSDDGRWLAWRHHREDAEEVDEDAASVPAESGLPVEGVPVEGVPEEPAPAATEAAPEEPPAAEQRRPAEGEATDEDEQEPETLELGSTLHLRDLASGAELVREDVRAFSFDDTSSALVFDVSAEEGVGNGLFAYDLRGAEPALATLHAADLGVYSHPTWAHERLRLAFVAAAFDTEDGEPTDAEVWTWDGEGAAVHQADASDAPEEHTLPATNELTFSRDGERLFFGFQPRWLELDEDEDAESEEDRDPYDVEAILDERGVDVWHWNDPRIQPNQKRRWEEGEQDRVHLAVAHLGEGRIVPLADATMPHVEPSDAAATALGRADVPYLREVTWDGRYADLYLVDLETGARALVAERLRGSGELSPSGRYVSYYHDGAWHVFDGATGETTNLTADLDVSFADEDHDYPREPSGYGQGEWLADDSAFLAHDKYDVWQLYTDGRAPLRLTAGRDEELQHRVVDRDPDVEWLEPGAELLLRAYHEREKHDAFVSARLGAAGTRSLYAPGAHRLALVAQAEDADVALVTRERYDEFPDLWVTDFTTEPRRLSDGNAQLEGLAWGSAELVEWRSQDGVPLQGVLIKPGGYEEGRRYPVLVYYYRFLSQRLHEFNGPAVNHRPSFPLYASNGYALFLPDIRFDVGRPGASATKCLVPGVQRLVDLGVADPDAIGLHGHSWSGYQTAFVITQTDAFACAIAGAPVSNMTSAYGGIRYGTGLARQFQYEKSQSRIGASLWEAPHLYVENSPLFFADRIDTPLLIQFGDEDDAVPWTQGIELYLALRRLDKDCIFLQYRGEPHHLQRYANKLDYARKMKQYLDHHLQGAEAPAWMTEGVPYRGE